MGSSSLEGCKHLWHLDAAQQWLSDGGNPCDLQRSNPEGSRRVQPVWTFWWQQAQQFPEAAWQDLVERTIQAEEFDPWLPDQNGDPSWWRTICEHKESALRWSEHWLSQGMDPNRWNTNVTSKHPCLLAAWMRTAHGSSMPPSTVVDMLNAWVQRRTLNPQAIETVSGDGAWHWLATQRPLISLDGQVGLAIWLLEQGVSPERRNRAGTSGWEAWSATLPTVALNAVAPLWARQQQAALALDLPTDTHQPLVPRRRL